MYAYAVAERELVVVYAITQHSRLDTAISWAEPALQERRERLVSRLVLLPGQPILGTPNVGDDPRRLEIRFISRSQAARHVGQIGRLAREIVQWAP